MSDQMEKPIKSGYVMILGLPNVGKSTLMNRLLKEKLAIVTHKPQTTRNRILGIAQGANHQVLFLDTPGVCLPSDELNRFLLAEIDRAFVDADLVCFMTEAGRQPHPREAEILKRLSGFSGPIFLLINKTDTTNRKKIHPQIEHFTKSGRFDEVFPISALAGSNCKALFEKIIQYLPYGPRYYPKEDISDITERFLVAEMVREKVFLNTHQEVPYSAAVMVNSFKEADTIIRIQADVIVERATQKGIVIGKGGSMMKKIGIAARKELESVFGKQIHLELFVKVVPNWSKNKHKMEELGYR